MRYLLQTGFCWLSFYSGFGFGFSFGFTRLCNIGNTPQYGAYGVEEHIQRDQDQIEMHHASNGNKVRPALGNRGSPGKVAEKEKWRRDLPFPGFSRASRKVGGFRKDRAATRSSAL